MSNSNLTGSESTRFTEIQKQWLVFEPISYDDFERHELYTVPVGQSIKPELIINSGSVTTNSSGSIEVEKIIHQFNDESEAANFITDIGAENIVSFKEKIQESDIYENDVLIEIQVINYPTMEFSFDYLDFFPNRGFVLDVFKSGSVEKGGVRKAEKKIKKNHRGIIISDTYLKYFQIKDDK